MNDNEKKKDLFNINLQHKRKLIQVLLKEAAVDTIVVSLQGRLNNFRTRSKIPV